jgi:hypothetical protein
MTTTDAIALGMIGIGVLAKVAEEDQDFMDKVYIPLTNRILKVHGVEVMDDFSPEVAKLKMDRALQLLENTYQEFESFELENGDEQWELKLANYSSE